MAQQDPSSHCSPVVLPHVHLVSSYRFPHLQQLPPQQALEYLLNAPKIVHDASPVAWQYFQVPPNDGTVILTWQSPLMQTRFASDGYIWADPEATYTHQIQGYTLEILVHRSGFRYGFESIATHSRQRFRVISKDPAAQGQIDPSLWIVHYGPADARFRFPANQISVSPDVQQTMQARSWLEKQGQLVRKEFMLRDRSNWPEVKFSSGAPMPGVQGQGRPYFNPVQQMGSLARQPQYYQQPPVPTVGGPPPPKRLRQVPPSQQPGGPNVPGMPPAAVVADSSIDDEENTTLGDLLDHLTPREISVMRYTQHHEWMEQLFSSPYAAGQILPVDLGLGLMGELAPLTEGLLDAPNADSVQPKTAPKSYHKLDPDQLKDFEKRVAEYTAKEEAELESLRLAHAKKLADLKRSRTYIKAERHLRESTTNPPSATPSRNLDAISADGASGSPQTLDQADGVVHELENSLGVSFDTKKHVVCVDKGGYIEEQIKPAEPAQQVNGNEDEQADSFTENGALNGLLDESAMDADNTAAGLLDQYGSNSIGTTPSTNLPIPQTSQPQSQSQSAVATPSAAVVDPIQNTSFADSGSLEATSGAQDLLDLDVEMSGMTNTDEKGAEGDWVMVDENATAEPAGNEQRANDPAEGHPDSINQDPAPTNAVDTTSGIFDSADFGSFDNLDTAGDALADYTNDGDDLGLDLDNSAFGDAFHGTEAHHGETEDGDNA